MRRPDLRWWPGLATLALLLVPALAAAVPIGVSGLGWLHDREMGATLERLSNSRRVATLDSNAIEDAAVILNSALADDGFQQPTINVAVTRADGRVTRFRFDPTFMKPVPRPLAARALSFDVHRGVRWRVRHVVIHGLTVFPVKEGQAYFRSDSTLLVVASTNAYSQSQLSRSADAMLDELRRRGYAEATVRARLQDVDRKTGAVTVGVTVHEGSRWRVGTVRISPTGVPGVKLPPTKPWVGGDWTPKLEDDMRQSVRLAYFQAGYPDVIVHLGVHPGPPQDGVRTTAIAITAVPGQRVTMGRVRFVGNKVTRESVLRRRVDLKPGEPLNPVELEHARYRISRLGVFDSVELKYEPPTGPRRDPVFHLHETPRHETNLLFGWGSYEELRGGVEYRQMNILGLAHQSRLRFIQSMKSTSGEYTYTVPELFGESVDGSAKLFGLERQEVAFLREEYGGTVSLRRALPGLHGDAMIGYTFQALRNRRNSLSTEATDERQVNAASVDFGLTTDRLDNPLRPRRGYHASINLEVASPNFGGNAQYQRLEISGAYHTPWGHGRWIHVGFSDGLVLTMGAPNDLALPVNKLFYPGGDNSIRGYRMGEAAPRAPDGRYVGAKTYTVVNLELEQALTQSWSVVLFGDALGEAAHLKNNPFHDRLYSVGIGLRYQTLIGPIRLEYGRNVNPRPGDPRGTLLLSIGYPF